eukprot:GHVR01166341.1.p1 GENE.GHVR01166341.1~~GHVR01166341.1.p1  ORF type:complete len:375 (-),score=60.53 GHVR01166341.1:186-1310(-)
MHSLLSLLLFLYMRPIASVLTYFCIYKEINQENEKCASIIGCSKFENGCVDLGDNTSVVYSNDDKAYYVYSSSNCTGEKKINTKTEISDKKIRKCNSINSSKLSLFQYPTPKYYCYFKSNTCDIKKRIHCGDGSECIKYDTDKYVRIDDLKGVKYTDSQCTKRTDVITNHISLDWCQKLGNDKLYVVGQEDPPHDLVCYYKTHDCKQESVVSCGVLQDCIQLQSNQYVRLSNGVAQQGRQCPTEDKSYVFSFDLKECTGVKSFDVFGSDMLYIKGLSELPAPIAAPLPYMCVYSDFRCLSRVICFEADDKCHNIIPGVNIIRNIYNNYLNITIHKKCEWIENLSTGPLQKNLCLKVGDVYVRPQNSSVTSRTNN